MNRILIIGGATFIGANLVRHLIYKSKNNVIGVDKVESSKDLHNIYSNKSFDFYIADINDTHILNRVMELSKPNIIINLLNGIDEAKSLIKIIDRSKESVKVIQMSTVNVYKNVEMTSEKSEVYPDDLEEASYICTESIIENYCKAISIPYNIIRADSIFGPRQNIANIIMNCYNGAKNNCIKLSNKGDKKRNITYIEDLNNAIVSVIEKGIVNEVYNVSSGADYSDLEIAFLIKEGIKSNANIEFNYSDKEKYYNINTNKIRELGWKPKSLKNRILQTVGWFENNSWFFK